MKNHLHLQNMTEIPRICAEQYKNRKKFLRFLLTCVIISKISIWMMNGYSLQLVFGDGGFVKRYVVKSSLQRPLHDQILSYQSMLDLCVREIPSITFNFLTLWPLFMDGVQLPQGYSHFEEQFTFYHWIFWCKSERNGQCYCWPVGWLCKVKDHAWNNEQPPFCTNILQKNYSQTHKWE